MVTEYISEFINSLRIDVALTFFMSIIFYIILLFNRYRKNKKLRRKKDLLVLSDFLYSIATSATIYGGLSAISYSLTGKLLFNKNLIISEEYIILFAGIILIAFGIIGYRNTIKKINGGRN